MTELAIKLSNVSKYYKLYNTPRDRLREALHPFRKKYHKKFHALEAINLEVKKGDILGIVGKNGSGKSTLLKLITGVLCPSEGSVKVSGRISALLELGAGFNPRFNGLENIKFYGMILGLSEVEIEEKLDEIVSFADLGEFIHQSIQTYSSGMKSRLGFAVAAHVDADIVILDEVLAVGDAEFKKKCNKKIKELFSSGCTIILVSHNESVIEKMCKNAVLIRDRQIIFSGETKEVLKRYSEPLK
jgi:homopolymeric O-antigen transport system ATP-binding protein